jgi:hypothetical protein
MAKRGLAVSNAIAALLDNGRREADRAVGLRNRALETVA